MWRPNRTQALVLAIAVAFLNLMAYAGGSIWFRAVVVIGDASLVIWWLEVRRRASPQERQARRAGRIDALYMATALVFSGLVAYAKYSDGNIPEMLGAAVGIYMLPLIVALLAKRFAKNRDRISVGKWTLAGILIITVSNLANGRSFSREDPQKLVLDAMKEAAGTKPIERRSNASDQEMVSAIRDVMGNVIALRRRYDAESAQLAPALAHLYEAETFTTQAAIENAMTTIHGSTALDHQLLEGFMRLPDTLRARLGRSSLSDRDNANTIDGFTKSFSNSEFIAAMSAAVRIEDNWVNASAELYGYAADHLPDLSVRSGKLVIANATVREQFNARLARVQALQQELSAAVDKQEQVRRSSMARFGVTPSDLGLK